MCKSHRILMYVGMTGKCHHQPLLFLYHFLIAWRWVVALGQSGCLPCFRPMARHIITMIKHRHQQDPIGYSHYFGVS